MRWWLVMLAACGDSGVSEPDVSSQSVSGERLKLAFFEYEGGAREVATSTVFVELFDAELDRACSLAEVGDGTIRCVPSDPAPRVVYTDDACTQPIGEGTEEDRLYLDDTFLIRRIMRRGEARLPPPEFVFVLANGNCEGGFHGSSERVYVELAGEAPFDELAEVREVQLPSTSRIAHVEYQSGDGFHLHRGFRDLELDVRCTPVRTPGGTVCAPRERLATASELFADAACTIPVAVALPGAELIRYQAPDRCESVFRLGAPTAGPIFRRPAGLGACEPATVVPDGQLFAIGEPVELAPMVPVATGTGRVQAIAYASGALTSPPLELFDTQWQLACKSDGGVCLTDERTSVDPDPLFLDAGCDTRVELVALPREAPVCADPTRFGVDFDGRMFEVLDEVVMPFRSPELLACEPAETPEYLAWHRLGREVMFHEFPVGVRVRER